MQQERVINDKNDIHFTKSDLILQQTGSFLEHYKPIKTLGKGAFGEVMKCIHKASGEERAVKILLKANMLEDEKLRLKYEIDLLKNLDHPGIVRLYEVFEDVKRFFLVTELCEGGELFDEIVERGSFGEKDGAVVFKQILSAISYCHDRKVAHRDLKPENILIDSAPDENLHIKIIDFGTSQTFEQDSSMQQVYGTSYYIAPEVLKKNYSEKCDVWSLGVILYIMMCGQPPFNGDSDEDIIKKVKSGKYSMNDPVWRKRSDECKDLVVKMMTVDPKKRITSKEALNHPWIQHKAAKHADDVTMAAGALVNLKNFRASQKMESAAVTFIVNQLSTKQEQEEMRRTFEAMDQNSDGRITKDELLYGYRKLYEGKLDEEKIQKEVNEVFTAADSDGSGAIDFSEWAVASSKKENVISDEKLQVAFRLFDQDGSGSISSEEIKRVLGVGKKFGDEKIWDQILKEVDRNGDGVITFDEFKYMMQKFLSHDL